ncbi:alpha-2-macroglobulin receptor-associated protein-like [Watersipora subatra]|uniref:alpha-2-macroglobulin receptor-associated protein-like n=1 Tax=Watersipora subatra TaxID=2589382 RepID=UPI00355C420A
MKVFTYLIVVTIVVIVTTAQASKYAKEVNDKEAEKMKNWERRKDPKVKEGTDDQLAFKSRKSMMIWKKGSEKHKDNQLMLNSLRDDLHRIDKELMQLKYDKYENKDPYGDMESALDEKVHALLVKYDIAGVKGLSPLDSKTSNKVKDHIRNDDRLDNLFHKAKKMGYTADELQDLKTEIDHHRRKMAELDALVGKYSALEERAKIEANLVSKKEGFTVESKELKELKKRIKEKEEELSKSMSRLGLLSDNVALSKDAKFTQDKVLRLWAEILNSNFTEEEQVSLKEELMHLENKLKKRDKLRSDADALNQHHQNQGHTFDDSKMEKFMEKKEKIKEKSEYIDKHVNKYVKSINSRIAERRHSEL